MILVKSWRHADIFMPLMLGMKVSYKASFLVVCGLGVTVGAAGRTDESTAAGAEG